MNDILRQEHKSLLNYGNILEVSSTTLPGKERKHLITTRYIEKEGHVYIDLMADGLVIDIKRLS